MQNVLRARSVALAMAALLTFASGCGTITGQMSQRVSLGSTPPGVKFRVYNQSGECVTQGTTPARIKLPKGRPDPANPTMVYLVAMDRPGQPPELFEVQKSINWAACWMDAPLVLLGVVPWVVAIMVDTQTGALLGYMDVDAKL